MPFRIVSPLVWLGVVAAIVGGLLWLAEELRAGAKAEVRAEYAEAARKKNVDIAAFNSADDAVAAIAEAALAGQVEKAGKVVGACPATAEQAAALTAIRRTR
jgi:hypothetical protein